MSRQQSSAASRSDEIGPEIMGTGSADRLDRQLLEHLQRATDSAGQNAVVVANEAQDVAAGVLYSFLEVVAHAQADVVTDITNSRVLDAQHRLASVVRAGIVQN